VIFGPVLTKKDLGARCVHMGKKKQQPRLNSRKLRRPGAGGFYEELANQRRMTAYLLPFKNVERNSSSERRKKNLKNKRGGWGNSWPFSTIRGCGPTFGTEGGRWSSGGSPATQEEGPEKGRNSSQGREKERWGGGFKNVVLRCYFFPSRTVKEAGRAEKKPRRRHWKDGACISLDAEAWGSPLAWENGGPLLVVLQ